MTTYYTNHINLFKIAYQDLLSVFSSPASASQNLPQEKSFPQSGKSSASHPQTKARPPIPSPALNSTAPRPPTSGLQRGCASHQRQ